MNKPKATKKVTRLPQFLQSALWSYDLDKFDVNRSQDQWLILNQVLNYGTDQQVNWALKTFNSRQIRKSIKRPQRGSWYPEALSYWLQVFNVKLNPVHYARAIKNIYPQT